MKNIFDMMAQFIEMNHVPLPDGIRRKEGGSNFEDKKRVHALMANTSKYSSFIIDYRASTHMESTREYFSSLDSLGGPTIVLGDDYETASKGKGRIYIDHGYFNNVLFSQVFLPISCKSIK